jgi:hypothetical protein
MVAASDAASTIPSPPGTQRTSRSGAKAKSSSATSRKPKLASYPPLRLGDKQNVELGRAGKDLIRFGHIKRRDPGKQDETCLHPLGSAHHV